VQRWTKNSGQMPPMYCRKFLSSQKSPKICKYGHKCTKMVSEHSENAGSMLPFSTLAGGEEEAFKVRPSLGQLNYEVTLLELVIS